MNDLRKSIIATFGIVIVVMTIQIFTESSYSIPNNPVVIESIDPGAFAEIIKAKKENITVVDLRSVSDFEKSHIQGALHFEMGSILGDEALNQFMDADHLYLYSALEQTTHEAALLLTFKGVKSIAVNGNFEIVDQLIKQGSDVALDFYSDEKMHFNYKRYIKTAPGKSSTPDKTKESKVAAAGGC